MDNELNHIIQSDPTLNFFLQEAKIDVDKLDHQVNLMCSSAKIALWKYINRISERAKNK